MDALLTITEAANVARLSPGHFYNHLLRRGVLPPELVVRIGPKSIRIHRERFLRWLDEGGNRDRFSGAQGLEAHR